MKNKILIVILVIVVIALGVLFFMKMSVDKNNNTIETGENKESIIESKGKEETKEIVKSKYSGDKRTLAVVIDNVGDAIPQTSLNEAMIVYEATVEGGLTRFLAIYKEPRSRINRTCKIS